MCIAALAMSSSEVAVLKDAVTGSLKKNWACVVHYCNYCKCKKNKTIHSYFHHISNASIPISFVRYATDFIKLNIVIVDG